MLGLSAGLAGQSPGVGILGTGQGGFNPAQYLGNQLQFGYRAQDLVSFGDDGLIAQATDYSNYGRHATASGALRPTLKTGILNNKPVMRFAGAQCLTVPAIDLSALNSAEVFVVAQSAININQMIYEFGTDTGAAIDSFYFLKQSSGYIQSTLKGNVGQSILNLNDGYVGWSIADAVYDKSLTSNEVSLTIDNGYTPSSYAANTNNTNNFGNRASFIGSRNNTTFFLTGDIAEILLVAPKPTPTQRQRILDYLFLSYYQQYLMDFADTAYLIRRVNNNYVSPEARLVYQTDATSVSLDTWNDQYSNVPIATTIGVRVNGVDYTTLSPSANGQATLTTSLPVGTNKTIELVTGTQSLPNVNQGVKGIYIRGVAFNAPATLNNPNPATKFVIYGDSIAGGYGATSPALNGWASLFRGYYAATGSVTVDAYGSRALYSDAVNSGVTAAFVAHLVNLNPTTFWSTIGTNDYGLNKWTAAAFGTAYAAFLDALHAALPSLVIYIQTPLVRTSEVANGLGNTLGDYRSQITTICSSRPWVTLVDGTAILTTSDLSDGVHPSTAGHAKYALSVKGTLGL